ncbi:MAG: transposase [Rugosibacter sp.]|nr:transposase [Rugosibacter sp.]
MAGHNRYALHTYWVGNLHRVLDVVSPGKAHSAAKARPGLIRVLEQLTPEQRPALIRGDCGFGNEPFIAELEERAQPYLFKLRQSVGVKKLLSRQFARDDWSTPGDKQHLRPGRFGSTLPGPCRLRERL